MSYRPSMHSADRVLAGRTLKLYYGVRLFQFEAIDIINQLMYDIVEESLTHPDPSHFEGLRALDHAVMHLECELRNN